jgi:hypothetical protein
MVPALRCPRRMVASVPDARLHESSGCVNFTYPPCTFEIDRAIRGVTPALSACRRPLHRRLSESEKPTVSPQRSPETREQVGRLFRRCDLFDWRFFGSSFFAMFIGGVQEPIDQAGAALLHDPRGLGLLPILENFVISLVAHGILHLRSAPTVKQLRSIVHSSELTIVSQFLQRMKAPGGALLGQHARGVVSLSLRTSRGRGV